MKVVPLPTHTRPLAHAKKTVAKSAHSSATKAVTKRRYPAKATAFKPATKRKAVVKKLPATTRPKK
ncbi:MAG: histone H1 [Hymenobacter sp.]|nr:MAG: histone H1 [Hymenobacter sp.]